MSFDARRWITLSACLIAALCAGFGYAWSVFTKPMLNMFKWSAADVSLSFTLIMSTAAATAIIAGKALEYMQPRRLLLIGGIIFGTGIICIGFIQSLRHLYVFTFITGIGLGTVYPGATVSNIVRLFPDKSGLASGVLTAGYGVGALVWAPLSVYLIENFKLMSALKILGILYLVIITTMSRMVATAPDGYAPDGWTPEDKESSPSEDMNWKEMMSTPAFYILAVIFVIGTMSGMMVVGHAFPIAQDVLKVPPEGAGLIVGFIAIGMVFGKILWGTVSDKIGRYPVFLILYAFAGMAMFAMAKISESTLFIIAMSSVGLCYGGFISLIAPVTADTFGKKHLGINFGIMFLAIAIAAYLGPMIAAVVKEAHQGDYARAFLIGGYINMLGMVVTSCYMILKKQKRL
jgi:OFA family oxalate/formate antiporter-like MFS transporter